MDLVSHNFRHRIVCNYRAFNCDFGGVSDRMIYFEKRI